jgi:hypothetical protein
MHGVKCLQRAFVLAMFLASFGCGKKSESTGQDPNKELTEQQKQHVEDLNKQREAEWGPQKK